MAYILCIYGLGLSFAKCAQVLARLGIDTTAGAICAASAHAASTDLVPVHQALVARANKGATLTMDETGWRVGGRRSWLWATNAELSVYWVAPGRSFADATTTVEADFSGWSSATAGSSTTTTRRPPPRPVSVMMRRCHEMEADLPRPDRQMPAGVKAILKDALAARNLDGPGRQAAAAEFAERR